MTKLTKVLSSALCMSVLISGCSSNDLKDASIEEVVEECIYLSELSSDELMDIVLERDGLK